MVENTRLVMASEDGEEEIEVEKLAGVTEGKVKKQLQCTSARERQF